MNQLSSNVILCNGKYKIERVLGQGGFGITYLAKQKVPVAGALGTIDAEIEVTVKEFFMKEFCNRDEASSIVTVPSTGSAELVEKFRQKFIKEAKNISKLNHPHIIKVLDVFEENDTAYYVMEYIDGGSLADYVKQHGALDEAIAINYIQQIGSALEYMHQKQICHYDVKPSNILLDAKGNAVLIDFGIAKCYSKEGNQTSSTPVGLSQGYAPLEQYQQNLQEFSPATDVYGLAATLYFLVTGKAPAEASIVLNEGIDGKPANVSDTTWNTIEKGMNPRKKDRIQCVAEFLKLLGAQASTLTNNEKTILSAEIEANNDRAEQQTVAFENEITQIRNDDEDKKAIYVNEGSDEVDDDKKYNGLAKSILRTIIVVAICIIGFVLFCIYGMFSSNEKQTEKQVIPLNKMQNNTENAKDVSNEGSVKNASSENVYDVVEVMPSFPGGQEALMSYLSNNTEYPIEAQKRGVEGRVVVSFVIEEDGSISQAKVVRSVDSLLDHEAQRVVKSMPKWKPGKQNGKYVRVKYTVPIVFRLQ